MSDRVWDTVAWYDRQAAQFSAQTANLDMGPLYDRFLHRVRPQGLILDAGCGAGRDALAFALQGFKVTAIDASLGMVRVAKERAGSYATGLHMGFAQIEWLGVFDGIWACASLLHVPLGDFSNVGARIVRALRPQGAWYCPSSTAKVRDCLTVACS